MRSLALENRRCLRSTCSLALRGRLKQKIRDSYSNPVSPRQNKHCVLEQIIGNCCSSGIFSSSVSSFFTTPPVPARHRSFLTWCLANLTKLNHSLYRLGTAI